jgi:hypothetical protein
LLATDGIQLEHAAIRQFSSGLAQSEYEVKQRDR